MRALVLSLAILVSTGGVAAIAQTAETATCKDGTTMAITTHRGACARHGGVQSYAPVATAAPAPAPATTPSVAPAASAPTASTTAAQPPRTTPGGGPGQVWVNSASKVYHCQGDRWYGKTRRGSYMTEAAAKAEGDRPDHGKACS